MRFFVQGIQCELPPGIVVGARIVTLRFVPGGQIIERAERLVMKPFTAEQQPLFQGGAIVHIDALHKLAAIEIDRLGQPLGTGSTIPTVTGGIGGRAGMLITACQQLGKGGGIKPMVALAIKLDGALADL